MPNRTSGSSQDVSCLVDLPLFSTSSMDVFAHGSIPLSQVHSWCHETALGTKQTYGTKGKKKKR